MEPTHVHRTNITITVPDDLLFEIDKRGENRSAFFRDAACDQLEVERREAKRGLPRNEDAE